MGSYDDLTRLVWGRSHVNPKLVRAFVRHVRGRAAPGAAEPVYVLTERGVGCWYGAAGPVRPSAGEP